MTFNELKTEIAKWIDKIRPTSNQTLFDGIMNLYTNYIKEKTDATIAATNAANTAAAAAIAATSDAVTSASNSATSAAGSATSAATSASNAATSASTAQTAKTAAETAQTGAETAKTAAEVAATNAAATLASALKKHTALDLTSGSWTPVSQFSEGFYLVQTKGTGTGATSNFPANLPTPSAGLTLYYWVEIKNTVGSTLIGEITPLIGGNYKTYIWDMTTNSVGGIVRDAELAISKAVFNVTTEVPLSAGQYYTDTTARAAVPDNIRKPGLEIIYFTAAGVVRKQRYIGINNSGWDNSVFWEFTVVNDLTTGGVNVALSAEMGKQMALDFNPKTSHTFTEAEKSIARKNIDAASQSLVNSLSENIHIDSGTALTSSTVGLLTIDGSVSAGLTDYKTYDITNNDSNNRPMFVLVDSNITGLAPSYFTTTAIFNGSTLLGQQRKYGKYIVLVEKGFTLKVSLLANGAIAPFYSYSYNKIIDKISLITPLQTDVIALKNNFISEYILQSGTAESSDGYYNGSGVFTAFSGYKSVKYAINPSVAYYASGLLSGGVVHLISYFTAGGVFISNEKVGTNGVDETITRFSLTIPSNAAYVGLTSKTNAPVLEKPTSSNLEAFNKRLLPIEQTALDYAIVTGTAESSDGYYNGSGVFTAFSGYKSVKYAINSSSAYYASGLLSGGAVHFISYYTSGGAFISNEKIGTNGVDETITRFSLTIPSNAAYVGLTSKTNAPVLENYGFNPITRTQVNAILSTFSPANYWTGKRIVWFGTSIPQQGYPQIVATLLGATVINEAQGSSMARRGKIDTSDGYGWTGLAWQNVGYALSQTIAEKNELINNWNTWKNLLTNTPPSSLDSTAQSLFLDCSFENRLYRHLASKGGTSADLYVFDHGHNDNLDSDSDLQFTSVPASSRDRNTFIGSINYLIDQILKDNPRARICFIGHYENARKTRISQAQEILAEYWDFPIIKMWQQTGWSQQQVTTTGYWSGGVWHQNGGASQTLTMTQIWMQDDLHPASTEAKNFLASILAENLKKIR